MMNPYDKLPNQESYREAYQIGREVDLQGWHSTHPVFDELIRELHGRLPGGLHDLAEVGSWKGASAIHMAKCRRALGGDFRLVCVDTWLGSLEHWLNPTRPDFVIPRDSCGYPRLYHQFMHNVVAHGSADVIVPVPLPSTIGAALFERLGLRPQLLYLDGSHEEADLLADLVAWWPMVSPGGIMFGDDFGICGVQRGLMKFLESRPAGVGAEDLMLRDGNFWILNKKATA